MLPIALAFFCSCLIVLALGGPTIRLLKARKIGDNPEFDQADINQIMNDKRGTPTMGGLLIVAAVVVSIAIVIPLVESSHRPALGLAIACVLAFSLLGVADDWFKLNKHRYARAGEKVDRQGLSARSKLLIQFLLAGAIGGALIWTQTPHTSLRIPLPGLDQHLPLPVPEILFVLIALKVIVGASNAVNLTDGLDGLAAGCMTIASGVFLIVSVHDGAPHVAAICAAVCGACAGFLWFNANPARVFMGDTGSLALGSLLGLIAMLLRHEILLGIVGIVFVVEALSVMIQVSYFKYTRKRFGTGRKVFLMSPLHHHFQKLNWPEPRIVIRFWIVGVLAGAAGLLLAL
jgi:phospho-N-acetylmuramoyl-pentapeptide-transferase